MPFKKVIFAIILLAVMILPVVVFAEDFGLGDAAAGTSLLKPGAGNSVPSLIGKLVGAGLSLIGVVFFGLILYGGIRWMTAMGRSEEVEKAKQIMEGAIIGLVIVLAAYAVTSFVINNLAGTGEGAPASPETENTPICDNIIDQQSCQAPYCEWQLLGGSCVVNPELVGPFPPGPSCSSMMGPTICNTLGDGSLCRWEEENQCYAKPGVDPSSLTCDSMPGPLMCDGQEGCYWTNGLCVSL